MYNNFYNFTIPPKIENIYILNSQSKIFATRYRKKCTPTMAPGDLVICYLVKNTTSLLAQGKHMMANHTELLI